MSKTLTVSDETYAFIKGQLKTEEKVDVNDLKDLIGKAWFFRTVTYHMIGRVVKLIGTFAFMENAIWVADSGRFMQAIKEGKLNEYEEVGDWFVNLSTVTDFGLWMFDIPKGQK